MFNRSFLAIGFCALASVFIAQAGPPLICHPFNIGTAASLPWGASSNANWDNPDPSYNPRHLAADTLRVLDRNPPVLVRMETLRRATIYGEKDHAAASELLAALKKRATEQPAALSLFDYGYFVESIKQMQFKYKDDITGGVDGVSYVHRALTMMPGSAEMQDALTRMQFGNKPQS